MDRTLPEVSPTTDGDIYRNALHVQKSRLLSRLKTLYRRFTDPHEPEIRSLKSQLKNIQKLIRMNYRIAVNSYWGDRIRAVRSDGPGMFPQINRIFQRSGHNDLEAVRLGRTTDNENILTSIGIDPDEIVLDNEFFIVEDAQEKVDNRQ